MFPCVTPSIITKLLLISKPLASKQTLSKGSTLLIINKTEGVLRYQGYTCALVDYKMQKSNTIVVHILW